MRPTPASNPLKDTASRAAAARSHSLAGDPHAVRLGVMTVIGAMFFGVRLPAARPGLEAERSFAPTGAKRRELTSGGDT
jgi:hypothetical protein